jgi:hypothetical protein
VHRPPRVLCVVSDRLSCNCDATVEWQALWVHHHAHRPCRHELHNACIVSHRVDCGIVLPPMLAGGVKGVESGWW